MWYVKTQTLRAPLETDYDVSAYKPFFFVRLKTKPADHV
jgi:hypothetical protein